MFCTSCGAELAAGVHICPKCGNPAEPVSADTRPLSSSPTVTRFFTEKDLGKTVVFRPEVPVKPIYGWLVVIEGADAWHDFKIAREDMQIFLGNGEECHLQLHDELLAKMHASVRLLDGKLTITDLDTQAGTAVNQQPITRAELCDGDEVQAGNSILKFGKL